LLEVGLSHDFTRSLHRGLTVVCSCVLLDFSWSSASFIR